MVLVTQSTGGPVVWIATESGGWQQVRGPSGRVSAACATLRDWPRDPAIDGIYLVVDGTLWHRALEVPPWSPT